mmetsp:Transcript_40403/g.38891  ORF Transcript_40403/g.38891 Transcript_40403/m.38891 type:complete len:139 (+) Transcript_40403:584-1000(+)
MDNIQKGHFQKRRKKSYDNLELVPNRQLSINNINNNNEYVQRNLEIQRLRSSDKFKPVTVNRQRTFTSASGFSSIINGVFNQQGENGERKLDEGPSSLMKSNDEIFMSFRNQKVVANRIEVETQDKENNFTDDCINPF